MAKKILLIAVFVMIGFGILSPRDYAQDVVGEEIKLYMGEPQIFQVNNPTRIAIGNPSIADVSNVGRKEISLSPKSVGVTTLVVWDNYGEQSYRIVVLAENMQEVKRRADNLLATLGLPGVYTRTADEEDKVLILGNVKTQADLDRVNAALVTLKDKIVNLALIKEEEAGVEVDMNILELNKDGTDTLGFLQPNELNVSEIGSPSVASISDVSYGGSTSSPDVSYTTSTPGARLQDLFKISRYSRSAFLWTLDALIREGKGRILSRPKIYCQSGKEAEILVGGEKPTFTSTISNGIVIINIIYKEYGIKLKVSPVITENKRVKIGLKLEVSEVEAPEYLGTLARAYPLKKRNITTEVYLNDGQTLSIGGLIKQKKEDDITKTPGLCNIPIIGALFRHTVTKTGGGIGEKGDVELFITLTPTIMGYKAQEKGEPKKDNLTTAEGEKEYTDEAPDPLQRYIRVVQKRILDNLSYPNGAKEAGFHGDLALTLRLSYTGELLDISVKTSSAYNILDENAVATAKAVAPYPPFPSAIEQKELSIEIPITYRLN